MTNLDRRVLLGIAGIAGAAMAAQATRAGSLNPPPGPVTPTGKSTDQIEPRIDLLNAPASANVTSDASHQYIVNSPGSYYLSGNLAVSKPVGILLQTSGVTLDLCGFELSGPATGYGIVCDNNTNEGHVVRDGTLSGFFVGVSVQAAACRFERLRLVQCTTGMQVGNNCLTTDCLAKDCLDAGIIAGNGAVLTRCVVQGTTGSSGISAFYGCTLLDCVAWSNGSATKTLGAAFDTAGDCILTRCTASSNWCSTAFNLSAGAVAIDCVASANNAGFAGFYLSDHCVARGCSANSNLNLGVNRSDAGAGFLVEGDDCVIEDCMASNNAGDGIGIGSATLSLATNQARVHRCETHENNFSGIHVYANDVTVSQCRSIKNGSSGIHVQAGSSNIIENNQTLGNSNYGVEVDSTIALVFGNQARGNSLGNYSIVAGNRVGTIVVPATNVAISGNSGGSAFTTDPYANIAF